MRTIDGARIREAIRTAEQGTSGRIGVHVTHRRVNNALEHARSAFYDARLHEHPDDNAVLFVIAPEVRKFAVYAGDALHARTGDTFWNQLVEDMTPYFKSGRLTDGLILGIERAGGQLRAHFGAAVSV